jgi:hypothetical protein
MIELLAHIETVPFNLGGFIYIATKKRSNGVNYVPIAYDDT